MLPNKTRNSVLELDFISIASLGPRALTKVESYLNFTESQKVEFLNRYFFAMLNMKKLNVAATTNFAF